MKVKTGTARDFLPSLRLAGPEGVDAHLTLTISRKTMSAIWTRPGCLHFLKTTLMSSIEAAPWRAAGVKVTYDVYIRADTVSTHVYLIGCAHSRPGRLGSHERSVGM